MAKKYNKKANKKATDMALSFFNSGKSLDQFLKDNGYIQKQR